MCLHRGDGVEEAFFTIDRVMTVFFHKFGDFFSGTVHIKDIGHGQGKQYALNVPLNDGIDDENLRDLFRPIICKVMEAYQLSAVILQCGADSLVGDKLGCFNLSGKGEPTIEEYYELYYEAKKYNTEISEAVMKSPASQQFLVPGRVVVVKSQSDGIKEMMKKGKDADVLLSSGKSHGADWLVGRQGASSTTIPAPDWSYSSRLFDRTLFIF